MVVAKTLFIVNLLDVVPFAGFHFLDCLASVMTKDWDLVELKQVYHSRNSFIQ